MPFMSINPIFMEIYLAQKVLSKTIHKITIHKVLGFHPHENQAQMEWIGHNLQDYQKVSSNKALCV